MKNGGFDALSFRKIAEELSISKANVHHHFRTKEVLAIEVTNHYAGLNINQFSDLAEQYAPDYVAFLEAIEVMFWDESQRINSCKLCVCSQITRQANVPETLLQGSRFFDEFYYSDWFSFA